MCENGYIAYQAMVSTIETSADNLKRICNKLDLHEQANTLDEVNSRLRNHVFRVGILGEFKRGKSTVINALLGKEVVPADILPCSATLNRIVWDAAPHAQINFKMDESGKTPEPKNVSVEELSEYITKLTTESEEKASMVEDSIVYYPCRFCQNGVEIIDTPGLNDDERMDKVSESVIPTLDAIIMVVVPGSPFGISEANFVRNKIMTSDLGRLIFIVNKIDTVRRPKDREKCVEGIRKKIKETVLEKAAAMYGENSQEYRTVESKLGGIRIYPISAANALDGKLEDDDELLANSGMPEFEEALTKLLTEERGMIELVPSVGSIMSRLKEADETIIMRQNALNLELDQFMQLQKEAAEKINESRMEKKQKVKEIKGIAASIYQELQPDVVSAYKELEDTVIEYVENYTIDSENFADENSVKSFQELISAGINNKYEMCLQECIEKMQVKIQDRLGQELENLEVYSKRLESDVSEVREMVPQIKSVSAVENKSENQLDKLDAVAMGVETVTNFLPIVPGLGGAISGFKDHGLLGGIVGFGSGFAVTHFAAYATAYTLIGAMGMAASAAIVPIGVIAGIAGAFGGKKITNILFDRFGNKTPKSVPQKRTISEKDILNVRSSLKEGVRKNVNHLRTEHTLENWLKEVTDETFASLSDKLDREAEEVLQGLQDTLTNIQVDISKGELHKESVLKQLNEYHQELIEIAEMIAPVKKRLNAALSEAT